MAEKNTKKVDKEEDDIDQLIADSVKDVVASNQQATNFTNLHSRLTKAGTVKEIQLKNTVNQAWKGGMATCHAKH